MSNVATGITGSILNGILLTLTTINLGMAIPQVRIAGWTRFLFFLCIWLTAAFDLPRYVVLASGVEYAASTSTSMKVGYSLHLVSSCFFFMSFSLIIRIWNKIMSGIELVLLGSLALITMNTLLAGLAIICIIALTSFDGTLDYFFTHPIFTAFSAFDGLKNLAYSLSLL